MVSPSLTKPMGVLLLSLLLGCSQHFKEGQELEKKQRLEEATIAYRAAFIEAPEDEEIRDALNRTNRQVAKENFQRYQDYLTKKDFKKALRRLEAASLQNPNLIEVQFEQTQWMRVLIAGKISLQFDRLQANIGLADEMQLQILLNTPSGQILVADISNESGLFFVEDLLYKPSLQELPRYSINTIGLRLKRFANQRTQEEFRKFINFRGLLYEQTQGDLQTRTEAPLQTVLESRSRLMGLQFSPPTPWFPPRIIRYSLDLVGAEIQVFSADRIDFMPNVLYLNFPQQRAFVDFGMYELTLNPESRIWSIQKVSYDTLKADYFYQFSENLAFYPYFFYTDGMYRYVKK